MTIYAYPSSAIFEIKDLKGKNETAKKLCARVCANQYFGCWPRTIFLVLVLEKPIRCDVSIASHPLLPRVESFYSKQNSKVEELGLTLMNGWGVTCDAV